jgi:hypothetical protein
MANASSLRSLLQRIDGSEPAIRNTASAMMKHYDTTAVVAVTEWRNCLSSATRDQILPLLYVTNEVLQISKRNRGSKFLEAFSPVLGQSLIIMCKKDLSQTERIRRTVKIWGDRRVFSVRFVQELLKGLERYRTEGDEGGSGVASSGGPSLLPPPEDASEFSPVAEEPQEPSAPPRKTIDDDEIMDILEGSDNSNDDGSDDEDDNMFLESSERGQRLNIEVNIDSVLSQKQSTPVSSKGRSSKRRRGSTASAGSSHSGSLKRRRRSTLSNNNLLDVWTRLNTLQQNYELAHMTLNKIETVTSKTPAAELENLVGDELQQTHRQTVSFRQQLASQRRNLYDIALERKLLQQETVRYLPWLEAAVKQDEDDLRFSDELELKLLSFQQIHPAVVKARDIRLEEEAKERQAKEKRARKREEAEESERFRQAAMSKETEAKPGMVWNPVTREYQALNTEETWRD